MTAPASGQPGLQPQRTSLAWSRAALAAAALAATTMRAAVVEGSVIDACSTAVSAFAALASYLAGRTRGGSPLAGRARIAVVGASVVLAALLATVAILVHEFG